MTIPQFIPPYGDDPEEAEANANRIVACVNGCAGINPDAVKELLEAVKAMQDACDEWAAEFTQKKRGMNWGIVNDAYLKASRSIAKAEGR